MKLYIAIFLHFLTFSNAWLTGNSLKKKFSSGVVAVALLGSTCAVGQDSAAFTGALEQVARVKLSLDLVNKEIETASDPGSIIKEIKLLMTNYKLKDNLAKSINLASAVNKINAKKHATAAYEDLAMIFEYFDDEVDNMTGKKSPSPKVLKLSFDATDAASKELDEFFRDFSSDISDQVLSKVKAEFSD